MFGSPPFFVFVIWPFFGLGPGPLSGGGGLGEQGEEGEDRGFSEGKGRKGITFEM